MNRAKYPTNHKTKNGAINNSVLFFFYPPLSISRECLRDVLTSNFLFILLLFKIGCMKWAFNSMLPPDDECDCNLNRYFPQLEFYRKPSQSHGHNGEWLYGQCVQSKRFRGNRLHSIRFQAEKSNMESRN